MKDIQSDRILKVECELLSQKRICEFISPAEKRREFQNYSK